jgi:hypothetical protein
MAKDPVSLQETLSIKPVGLWSYPNQLSAVPQGALRTATNTVIDRPNIIEQRRGINAFGDVLLDDVNKIYNFQNSLILHHGTTFSYDSTGLGVWVDYTGVFSPPATALTIHSIQANKNIYFTTSTGIKKLDSLTGVIQPAGAPPGLDGSGTTTGFGWFTNTTQVAYRIIFGYNDVNGNLIVGAPSQRIVVSNNSGSATNAALTFTVPNGLSTDWFYQIYRSPMSINLATEPNDECALIHTANLTSTDLTNKYATFTDNIADALKGAMIYTASSQQGITQSNYQPPIATDITYFKGFAMYANTTELQRFFLTIISVGSPNGIQVNDTITINSIVYTAKAAETIAAAQFEVFTGGTVSQNITNTANSLVRVINRYTTNTSIYAYYQSGYSEAPGKILLTERTIGSGSFTVISSRPSAFVPDLTTTQNSSSSSNPNYIFISKYQQPEAVPTSQSIPAGSADKEILRIIALRDYVLIFKQDGVFQLTGSDIQSFQIAEVDKTLILRGIETAVALNNKVFMFSNQTVVSVTFNEGAVLKSFPIRQDLLVLSSPLYPNFDTASFGISNESDNKYILGTVTQTTDTTATQYFVYNYITDAWTQWVLPWKTKTGIVNPTDDKLYFGSADPLSMYVYQERKNYNLFDYADNSYLITIISSLGTIVEVNSTTGLLVGWALNQGDKTALIAEIIDLTHIRVNRTLFWTAGAATIYMAIPIILQFVAESCGNPGLVKHFKEVHSVFSTANFAELTLGFTTDFNSGTAFSRLVPKTSNSWGYGSWGNFMWGGGPLDMQVIRALVPLVQRRGHWIILSMNYADALTAFAFDGFAIYYSGMSQKFH